MPGPMLGYCLQPDSPLQLAHAILHAYFIIVTGTRVQCACCVHSRIVSENVNFEVM